MVTLYANDEELLRKNIVYYFANTMVVSGEHILEPSFGNVPQSIGVFSFILSQIACSAYKVIQEKCDDLLDRHDNLSSILNLHQEG